MQGSCNRFPDVVTCAAAALVAAGLLVLSAASAGWAQEPSRRALPRLGEPGTAEEIRGTIADTTRGRPGPVRLVMKLADGSELAVLVAPDARCDRLGLSLAVDEEISVVGRVLPGERPLLVAEAIVVQGRRVDVRPTHGGPLAPESAAAETAVGEGGPPRP